MEGKVKRGWKVALWILAVVLAFVAMSVAVFLCREAANPVQYSNIVKYLDDEAADTDFIYSTLSDKNDDPFGMELKISLQDLSDYFEQGTVNVCEKKAVPEGALRFWMSGYVPGGGRKKYSLTVYTELNYIEFYDESAGIFERYLYLETDCSQLLEEVVMRNH